jgi:predicted glutamine amidotransferase
MGQYWTQDSMNVTTTLIKSSEAISHVRQLKVSDVSGNISVLETLENFNHLTWLMARNDFIKASRQESLVIKHYYYYCYYYYY